MALATLEGVEDVRAVDHWRLWVRFEDGVEGEVDVSALRDGPMFAALHDRGFFDTVHVCMKVVSWGDGLELDPCWLYGALTEPEQNLMTALSRFQEMIISAAVS